MSLASGSSPFRIDSAATIACSARLRVSLKMVEDWTPSAMSLIEAISASCPVTIGRPSSIVGPRPAFCRALMMPRESGSAGASTPASSSPLL